MTKAVKTLEGIKGDALPKGWEVKKLGEVCQVIAGQSPKGKFYNTEGKGLPFYQGKKDYGKKYLGKPTVWTTQVTKEAFDGDILMSVRAPVGPVNFATENICIGRGLAAIRTDKLIDKEFLFSFLTKHASEITGTSGAVFNSINKTQIGDIPIFFPSLIKEQRRIVKILNKAFTAIDKAKENLEKNIQNAWELFQSELNTIFTEGQTNPQWQMRKLGEVCDKTSNIKWQDNTNKTFQYIDLSSVSRDTLSVVESSPINYKTAPSRARQIVLKEDIIFATTRPTLKRLSIITEELSNQICSTGFVVLRPKEILPRLIFYFLQTDIFIGRMESLQRGTSYPAVSDNDVKNFLIPVPTIPEQKQIVAKLDKLSEQTKSLELAYRQKYVSIDEMKKSLLQQAFMGQLT